MSAKQNSRLSLSSTVTLVREINPLGFASYSSRVSSVHSVAPTECAVHSRFARNAKAERAKMKRDDKDTNQRVLVVNENVPLKDKPARVPVRALAASLREIANFNHVNLGVGHRSLVLLVRVEA